MKINGDVYVYGALVSLWEIKFIWYLNAKQISYGSSPTLYNGSVALMGNNSIYSTKVSNQSYDIPMDIQYNGSEKEGLLIVEGKTVPFLKVFIDDTEAAVQQDGYFKVEIENKNEDISVIIQDVFGSETTEIIEVSSSDPPEEDPVGEGHKGDDPTKEKLVSEKEVVTQE